MRMSFILRPKQWAKLLYYCVSLRRVFIVLLQKSFNPFYPCLTVIIIHRKNVMCPSVYYNASGVYN